MRTTNQPQTTNKMLNVEFEHYLEMYGREWIDDLLDNELTEILMDGMDYAAKRDFERFLREQGYIDDDE